MKCAASLVCLLILFATIAAVIDDVNAASHSVSRPLMFCLLKKKLVTQTVRRKI